MSENEQSADSTGRKRDRGELSSESDNSFSCSSPLSKKTNEGKVNMEEALVALQKSQTAILKVQKAIQESIDTKLASKADLQSLRDDLNDEIAALTNRIDTFSQEYEERFNGLDGRLFDLETRMDRLGGENEKLKTENDNLRDELNQCKTHINDLEQYGRRWNLKVFNVEDNRSETAAQTTTKVCNVFTKTVGVRVNPNDIVACHRLPNKDNTKRRVIICRFKDRGLRDRVLKDRKKCKGKGVSISEDLTLSNSKLVSDAYKHEHCKSTWSVNGKCFGLLVNKTIVRFRVGDNVNHVIRDGMKGVTAASPDPEPNNDRTGNIDNSTNESDMVVVAEVHAEESHTTEID